jgi:hypothetical protein
VKRAPYLLLLAAIGGGCSFEASCGKKKVETREFEATIKERTTALGLNPTKVDCGEPVEAKVGVTFTCKVELDGEKTYDMNVAVTGVDEKADRVDLDPKWAGGNAVVAKKIEEMVSARLAERYGAGVGLDCGEPLRFVPDDDRFTCDLTSGTYQGKVTLIFADGTTNLDDLEFESHVLGKSILEGILTPSVREKTSPEVVVTCGDQAMIPRPADGVIWCDIADATQKAKIKVVVDEQNNVTRWDVADPPP